MNHRPSSLVLPGLGIVISGFFLSSPAHAQVQYGPWRKTNVCRPASPPSGFFRGGVQMPHAPGSKGAEECKWTREVEDCPRIRDKVRHFIRCSSRRQDTDYTLFPPRD